MTRMISTFLISGFRLRAPLRLPCWGICCFLLHSFFTLPSLEARISVDAIPAQPFGIAEIVIDLPASPQPGSFDASEFYLAESHGRALYPVFTEGRLRRAVGDILGNADGRTPATISVLFLFTGADPLEITLHTPSPRSMTIHPRPQPPRVYERTIKRWWREYHAAVREQEAMGDYPPIVQTYLTSMLSRRLGIAPPLRSRAKKRPSDPVQNSLEMLLGLEGLRLASLRKTSLGERTVSGPADRPLPVFTQQRLLVSRPPAGQVTVEEIAGHVPRECFYIRFGSFTNYLWLDRLVGE